MKNGWHIREQKNLVREWSMESLSHNETVISSLGGEGKKAARLKIRSGNLSSNERTGIWLDWKENSSILSTYSPLPYTTYSIFITFSLFLYPFYSFKNIMLSWKSKITSPTFTSSSLIHPLAIFPVALEGEGIILQLKQSPESQDVWVLFAALVQNVTWGQVS